MAPPTMLRMAWEAELRYFHMICLLLSRSLHPCARKAELLLVLLLQLFLLLVSFLLLL